MFATNTQYNTEPLLTESDKRPNTSPVSTISLGNLQLSSPPVNSILGRNISSGPGPDLINPRKLTVTTVWGWLGVGEPLCSRLELNPIVILLLLRDKSLQTGTCHSPPSTSTNTGYQSQGRVTSQQSTSLLWNPWNRTYILQCSHTGRTKKNVFFTH